MRVVIAEDMTLLRVGLARLLHDDGVDVVAQVGDADALMNEVAALAPDAAVIDIKMPPTWTDEGAVAARRIRAQHPGTAVLLLSSYLDARYATELISAHPAASGYLLKDHVSDPSGLLDALHRVVAGEAVVDPAVVSALLERKRRAGPLDRLTARQREILALMAEGYGNARLGSALQLSPRTVESHVRSIFTALDLPDSADTSRRVLAVLQYLRG